MKLSCVLVSVLPLLFSYNLQAACNSCGAESPVVVSEVIEVKSDGVLVLQLGEGHKRYLKMSDQAKAYFIGFKGVGKKNVKTPQVGFGALARVNQGDVIKNIKYTPKLPLENRIPEKRHEKTDDELFSFSDQNGNGEVDYIEFNLAMLRSEKHNPDYFQKYDKDKSDTLNKSEFMTLMNDKVSWFRLSRKTLDQWMLEADQDKNGQLSVDEFMHVTISKSHNADWHRGSDRDKSGELSKAELKRFLDRKISMVKSAPKLKKKKKA